MTVDLEDLGFDRGAALLVKRALAQLAPGQAITVQGSAADLLVHLRAWCRTEGHEFRVCADGAAQVVKGVSSEERWSGAERAGHANPFDAGAVLDHPPQRWGLAARGALVEAGSPEFHFPLAKKSTYGRSTRSGCMRRLPEHNGIPQRPSRGTPLSICRMR